MQKTHFPRTAGSHPPVDVGILGRLLMAKEHGGVKGRECVLCPHHSCHPGRLKSHEEGTLSSAQGGPEITRARRMVLVMGWHWDQREVSGKR